MGKITRKIVAVLIILFIFFNTSIIKVNAEKEDYKVLFMTGYNSHTADFDNRIAGIKEGLGEDVELQIKYLSYKITENIDNELYYYNDIKNTVENEDYDAVIIGDYLTLQFVLKYKEDIFNSLPIVFFGIFSDIIVEKALEEENITGIQQVLSIESTLDLIKKYHPYVNNIVILNNYEDTILIETLKDKIISSYKDISFEIIYTSEITEKELSEKLKEYDKNDAIITMYANDFKDFHWINDREVNELISDSAKGVPLYNLTENGIGYGSIGGKVTRIASQGKRAGQIAKDIIQGRDVESFYNSENINQYIFDYNIMRKFGIKSSDLPKNSIIKNSPKEFIYKYKSAFIFLLLFVISLIAVIIILIRLITYKKKHGEIMQKALEEIEEVNKLKSYFIVNMNHELKTPITVINSVMQLTKYKRKHYDNYLISSKNISLIEDNCQRLLRLINNIIDLDKIDSQKDNMELENINIVEFIEDTVLSVVPFAQAKDVEIVFDTTEEEIMMAVDKNKMERIVLNLLSNAIKYSKEVGYTEVKLDTDSKKLILTVEDNGIGMEEENIDKIFNRFVQLDSSLTRKTEGSGIGLSIVKSFVECHGGNIKVESELHKGSKFIVEIPIKLINPDENKVLCIDTGSNIKQELSDIYL